MILPLNYFKGNSEGENLVWQKFSDFLPSDFVSFHNYNIGIWTYVNILDIKS